VRYLAHTGASWHYLPCDFPPRPVVSQQVCRWVAAGSFETLVRDTRVHLACYACGFYRQHPASIGCLYVRLPVPTQFLDMFSRWTEFRIDRLAKYGTMMKQTEQRPALLPIRGLEMGL